MVALDPLAQTVVHDMPMAPAFRPWSRSAHTYRSSGGHAASLGLRLSEALRGRVAWHAARATQRYLRASLRKWDRSIL
jgi:hypothetical protein